MTIEAATWAKALGALAAVLGLLWVAARLLRATGTTTAKGRRLAVQEVLALDTRRRLLLIRCDGRDVLVLTGGAQDAVVGWLPGQGSP